jgi:hypothetical protein
MSYSPALFSFEGIDLFLHAQAATRYGDPENSRTGGEYLSIMKARCKL